MPLLQVFEKDRKSVLDMTIQQIVTIAGDGVLKDGSDCSTELWQYLAQVNTVKLAEYADYCLSQSFPKSGLVLQDVVNELGRRLDYEVENGLYSGRVNQVGYDGIWKLRDGSSIIVEVKTTDAYRINLQSVTKYRNSLIETHDIDENSSILFVVGREDTGDFEAQIRGSRHAWDIRLISIDALLTLVHLKNISEDDTGKQIWQLLKPMEYTKLDSLVGMIFTTAKEIEEATDIESKSESSIKAIEGKNKKSTWEFTDSKILQGKREEIIKIFGESKNTTLLKKTRATYWNVDRTIRAVCTISKRYDIQSKRYWYAYHPAWDEFLSDAKHSYVILGCMELDRAFAIPHNKFKEQLQYLNMTTKEELNKSYWHVAIGEDEKENQKLILSKSSNDLDLKNYAIKI